MFLIDKKGIRPICESCHKAARDYGIAVRPGKVFVCKPCLEKASESQRRPQSRPA